MGEEGCHRLRCGRRGSRASFLPGSGTRTRRKQVNNMATAASEHGPILFANVHVGGIPRSMDGGRTWQPTIDIKSDVHEVRAHQADPDIVVAASAIGLCISRDAGATWIIERDGLHSSY